MNKFVKLLLCISILLLQFIYPVYVLADVQELETTLVSESDREYFLSTLNMDLVADPPSTNEIACFDINDNGYVALGFNTSPQKTILIYDSTGSYLYGYTFSYSGSIGIAFIDNDMAIYFARSSLIAVFAPNGQLISLENVKITKENNELVEEMMYRTYKELGNSAYRLDRDIGIAAQSYSRLIITNPDGTETIFYDVTMEYNIRTIIISLFWVLFSIIVLLSVIKQINSKRK